MHGRRMIRWLAGAALAVAAGVGLPAHSAAQNAEAGAEADSQAGTKAAAQRNAMERALESRSKGGDSATVVVFEIADFQCPFCGQFARQVEPELNQRYVETGRVQWVFVNLPMHNHPLAWHAAEAALCAGAAGGQFWAMHDRLFADQDSWTSTADPQATFAAYAADLGVPADAYRACTEDDQVASLILQDLGSAVSAGITGTPTFIIMKDQQVVDQIVGVKPIERWDQVLGGALGDAPGAPGGDTGGQ